MNCNVFKTREEAEEFFINEYGELHANEIVYCVDKDGYTHSDEVITCNSCGDHYSSESYIFEGLCSECYMNAEDEDRNLEELRKDYYDSVL